jgi:translation initiation factor IF-3
LNSFKVGEAVKVSINLRGREWVDPQGVTKYFNAIQGWRVERVATEATAAQMPPMPAAEAFAPATNLNEEEADDLPF